MRNHGAKKNGLGVWEDGVQYEKQKHDEKLVVPCSKLTVRYGKWTIEIGVLPIQWFSIAMLATKLVVLVFGVGHTLQQ